jgi:hypothetical protein
MRASADYEPCMAPGEQGCARKRVVTELLLQQRELGVISRSQLAPERFADHDAITGHDCSDLRRDLAMLALALAGEHNRTLHERTIIRAIAVSSEHQAAP